MPYHASVALTDIDRRLCELIDARADELLAQLVEHVAIPTGHNYTTGLDQYRGLLTVRLSALGAVIEHIPGQLRPSWLEPPGAGSAPGASQSSIPLVVLAKHHSAKSPCILIVGHLDTVHDPRGSFQKLDVDRSAGIAVGPGCVDMKGGVLIAITALEVLTEAGVDLNWTVLLNSDEEMGSFHSEAALREAASGHDLGIVLEPALADGALAVERMGSGQFKIEVHGRSAHVGRAFADGKSAVNKLAQIITALSKLADPDHGMIVNVGPLQGGTATNIVAEYAACWGNVRFADAQKGDQLVVAIDAQSTSAEAMPRVVVHRHWNRPAKPQTEAVRQFAQAAAATADDLNQSLPFASTGGVCDGNILQAVGLPALDTLGVRGGNLHRPDEFVELASLVQRCQLLAVLLTRIAEGRVKIPAAQGFPTAPTTGPADREDHRVESG